VAPEVDDLATLVERVRTLQRGAGGRRVVVGITGSPGAGKTWLAIELVAALGPDAVHLPMDGFHLANATLDRLGRHDRKGAVDTFDGWGFLALLQRLHAEGDHTVYAPSFRREVDEPVAAEIAVEPNHRVVVVEGNYLLVPQRPWVELRFLFDQVWYCERDEQDRLTDLIARHREYGKSPEEARRWALGPDQRNAALIASTRLRSDLVVALEELRS
jgi:pantothenate kinase